MASFARELSPRTFGFAMGSVTVFVPQVVVLETGMVQMLFRALGFLFPQRCGCSSFSSSRLSHVRCSDSLGAFLMRPQSDGEVG